MREIRSAMVGGGSATAEETNSGLRWKGFVEQLSCK